MSRWSPKKWTRPRSRAHREAHDGTPDVTTTDILREMYGDGWERPDWAKTARKFGWLTFGQYYDVEPTMRVQSAIEKLLYRPSPFLGMLAKLENFKPNGGGPSPMTG